jgi:hypothetical protein
LTNSNWDFTVPAFEPLGTYTVLDNVIRVEFNDFIENDNNEISAAITGNLISLDGDTINFTGTFTSPTCLPAETTNGAGDLQFFYIQVNTDTWNTDATGTSSGDVNSTDRSGLPQNIVPDIAIPKDTAGAFITLIDQHKNRIFHYMGGNIFTNVSDHCRPTLYQIDVDQAVHNMPVVDDYDAHNFFQLYYSEAVTIGDLVVSGPMERSETTFIDATEHGGALIESTPDVEVIGYFEYTGTFQYSSDEPIPDTANSLYQTTSHRLVIYISGYRDGLGDWPGYHWNVSNPLGGGVTIDVLSNSFITDNSANNNQIDDSYDPASFTNAGGWDIDPPAFSTYQPGPGYNPTNIYEIVTLDTNVNGTLDRLEFHLHDDSSNETGWLSTHPDPNSGGIRDCTILNLDMDAFFIEEVGVTPLTNAYNVSCNTDVNNLWFGIINVNEDQYFRLDLNEGGYSWGLLSRLYLTYDASIGHITDLAGNRLESATEIECIERIPPRIDFTLAVVGQQTVFVKFSEKVYGNDAAPRIPIDIYDFAIAGGTNTFTGITYLDLDSDNGVQEIFLTLQNPLTENEAVALFIQPQASSIYDYIGLDMSTVPHRITDIGLGVVVPVWADDGVHSDILHGDTGALRDFDGTGYLMDRDITLELSILSTNWQGASCRLYFDIDPDSSYLYNELWLPTLIPSFNDQANLEARSILPFRSDGAVRDFIIPSSDEEILNDAEVEFIIKLGDLFCARVTNPADPRTVVPWSFTIKDIILQKSNVTILNNVINPSQGEHTILHLILDTAGIVTIQVFDLKGDIVDVLHRGRLTEGEHIFTWDGQNRGGRDVVRGIYFIKVIGPDINEIRKVLVVK